MYKIKKVPSPTGYTILESEIEVNRVDGIQIVYENLRFLTIESIRMGKSELLLFARKWMLEKMILAYQKHQCLIKS